MVQLSLLLLGLAATSVHAAPTLSKRIQQTISASTAKWEQACLAAGGGLKCNPVSVTAFTTLLAAAGPCDQQNSADAMIDLAKSLNNDGQMITFAQIFAQQPRNTPSSESVPYCQTAPKNAELNGLFQCQFAGAKATTFVGGVAVGATGTIPFGHSTILSPAGSCPANPAGPITDGTQLVDITQNPGSGTTDSGNTGSGSGSSVTVTATIPDDASTATAAATSVASSAVATATGKAATTTSTGFALANGQDAQALNAKFATLTATSTCTSDENACISGAFAQCVNGNFVTTSCSGGLICAALPLVNSRGTSITCTTTADAETRIANTGATGGITGSGSTAASPAVTTAAATAATTAKSSTASAAAPPNDASTSSSTSTSSFALKNGQDAQALNAKFASLSASSACQSGEVACVGGAFAKCSNGKFVTTACAGGLTCAALPLVNSAGTSVTCTTQADALARIARTGATGGLTGA